MKKNIFLIITFFCLNLFSCTDTESRTVISREDLIGVWRQEVPDTFQWTGENGQKSIWVKDEYYHINNDLTFELTGKLFFRTGSKGHVVFNNSDTSIDFTLIGDKTNLPDGGTIQILKNQYWTWNVISLQNGILEVETHTKHQNDSTLVVSTLKEKFIKQI